jgi:hypothetical protein
VPIGRVYLDELEEKHAAAPSQERMRPPWPYNTREARQGPIEGRWVERVIGIDDVRQDIAMLRTRTATAESS